MGEISATLVLAGATATRNVDALAQRALAYRRHDPLERRRILIHLGEPGQQLLDQVDAAILERATALLDSLGARQRAELARLLERLTTASAEQSRWPTHRTPRARSQSTQGVL